MNINCEIVFGARTVENYGKAPASIRATLTTERAESSYGIPVVMMDGQALGRADIAALAPTGFWAGVRTVGCSYPTEINTVRLAMQAAGFSLDKYRGEVFFA